MYAYSDYILCIGIMVLQETISDCVSANSFFALLRHYFKIGILNCDLYTTRREKKNKTNKNDFMCDSDLFTNPVEMKYLRFNDKDG